MATSKDFCCFDRKFVFLYYSHSPPPHPLCLLGITENHLHTYWWQMFWHVVVVVVAVSGLVADVRARATAAKGAWLTDVALSIRAVAPHKLRMPRREASQLGWCRCCGSTAINYPFIMNKSKKQINCCLPFKEGRRKQHTHHFCNGNL